MLNSTIKLSTIIETIYLRTNDIELMPLLYDFKLDSIDKKIEVARGKIFSFDYPTYGSDEDKQKLEQHILSHYYMYAINTYSVQEWQLMLRNMLNEIMPKWVEIYNSQAKLIAEDILNPYHIDETKDETREKQSTGTSTDSNTGKSNSDTDTNTTTNSNANTSNKTMPQTVMVQGNNYFTNMQDVDANDTTNTNANSNLTSESSSESASQSSENNTMNYTKTLKGNIGNRSLSELTKEYQSVIMNIELGIIKELEPMFFGDMLAN